MQKFSTREAIRFGWETFKKNWRFLLVVDATPLLISLFSWLTQKFGREPFTFVWSGVFWLVSVFVAIGIIKIYLVFGSGGKPKFSELYSNFRYFPNYLIGDFLYFLIVFVGLILLIVPGIIFAIRLGFWKYALIDGNLGPIDSLKKSWEITDGQVINLISFRLVQLLVNILGLLALGVGVLVSGPVTALAEVFVYRKLSIGGNIARGEKTSI